MKEKTKFGFYSAGILLAGYGMGQSACPGLFDSKVLTLVILILGIIFIAFTIRDVNKKFK